MKELRRQIDKYHYIIKIKKCRIINRHKITLQINKTRKFQYKNNNKKKSFEATERSK